MNILHGILGLMQPVGSTSKGIRSKILHLARNAPVASQLEEEELEQKKKEMHRDRRIQEGELTPGWLICYTSTQEKPPW